MILRLLLSVLILLVSVAGYADFPRLVPVEVRENGVGDWKQVPFGEVRVLSCTTGVKDLGMAVGGVQVRLNPEWTLKKPTLKPLSEKFPSWIEAPVRAGSGRNTVYQKEVFFPFIYTRNPKDSSDLEVGIQGVFPACLGDTCMDFPVQIGLNLKANENDYTGVCAYIMEEQKQAPLPPEAHPVKGFAKVDGDVLTLSFTGINGVNVAFLQTKGHDIFEVQETQLEKNGLFMRVKTKPWPMHSFKEWILVTNKGVFRVPVQMQLKGVVLPQLPPSLSIWIMGWELFFLTPLFIWWGLGVAKTKKIWQKQILRLGMFLPIVFVLWVIRQSVGIDGVFSEKGMIYYGFLLWGFVCFWPPQKWWLALGMFLIWPRVIPFPQLSIGLLLLWMIVMLVEIGMPFVLLYFKADEIGKVLRDYKKKHFFVFNLTFLIPTLGLLIMGICHLTKMPAFYQNELNTKGLSIVCEKCASWQEVPDVSFIKPDSILGGTLQKIYHRSGTIVIWQEKGKRFLLPPNVSVKKVKQFIKNWHNYHVRYRP